MPKENLREHLDGNELDLSLNNLKELPVKELAALPRATHLDFSNNALMAIPVEFCQLIHIVKLDLSQNQLKSLPDNFGALQRLQILDLYNNQLQTLPVSFCELRKLKWLDVKNNPLDDALAKVAGDCLDDAQCKTCATKVVAFMRKKNQELELQRQKALEEEQAREASRKAAEEAELQRKRAEKKAEKERRRREIERRKQEEKERLEAEAKKELPEKQESAQAQNGHVESAKKKQKRSGLTCCGVLLAMLVGLVAVLFGLYFYCSSHADDQSCAAAKKFMLSSYSQAQEAIQKLSS